jgi:hypothetical protein
MHNKGQNEISIKVIKNTNKNKDAKKILFLLKVYGLHEGRGNK